MPLDGCLTKFYDISLIGAHAPHPSTRASKTV
jgi:hypothetical protein